MKKIINPILVICIISLFIAIVFNLLINKEDLKYNYNEIKVLIKSSDVNNALKTFNQFDEYFIDTYIDSTDVYKIKNSLKLYPEKHLNFYLDIISCDDLKCILEIFENKFNNNIVLNEYERQIFENIISVILGYYVSDDLSINIGYNLLKSFNNITSNNYNNYVELNLVLNSNINNFDSYNKIFDVLNKIDYEILDIIEINVHSKSLFQNLNNYKEKHNLNINVKLNEYYYGFSNSIDDLKKTIILINDEPSIHIESLLDFVPSDDSMYGDRFKKIKRHNIKKEIKTGKMIVSNEKMIDMIDSYKYHINQIKNNSIDNYIYKKNISELLDELSNHLVEKDNLTKTIYMQDQFYEMKKSFSKFFHSLEPITIEYLNPSIKKEFIDDDVFISKIIFANSSDK